MPTTARGEVQEMTFVHCRQVAEAISRVLGRPPDIWLLDPTIAGFKASLKEWKHPPIHPADHLSESLCTGVRTEVDSMVLTPAPRR